MTDTKKRPVWSWTDAVAIANVKPLTKLVCLNIARYLSSAGKGWRISIKEMEDDTGLSNKSLSIHLKAAEKAGLIIVKREINTHGHRTGTTYTPRFPDGSELSKEPAEMVGPDEAPTLGNDQALSEGATRGPDEAPTPDLSEGATRQVSTSLNSSFLPPKAPQGGPISLVDQFEMFWSAYPRKVGKMEAWRIWHLIVAGSKATGDTKRKRTKAVIVRALAADILAGAERFSAASQGKETEYIAHPSTWLHAGRWMDDDSGKVGRPVSQGFIVLKPETHREQFEAWREFYAASGDRMAVVMRNHGVVQVPTMMPPEVAHA